MPRGHKNFNRLNTTNIIALFYHRLKNNLVETGSFIFVTIFIFITFTIQHIIAEESSSNVSNSTLTLISNQTHANYGTLSENSGTSENSRAIENSGAIESSASTALPSLRLDWHSSPSPHPIRSMNLSQSNSSDHNNSANIFEKVLFKNSEGRRSWNYQLLPSGRIYQSYLAGVNESRLGITWNNDHNLGNIWDATVGGNAGLLRYGTYNSILPEGIQIEVEASAHLRMDYEHERDMDAMDYRFALPITFGNKVWQFRTGYFHTSSHLGDERMIRLTQLGLPHKRINYVRESILLGLSYRINSLTRVYFEIDYSTWLGELTKPWHFQFGIEYSSPYPMNNYSYTPFGAINVQLLEERSYDGNITIQAGLQWRNKQGQLFRIGLQYFRGISDQYEHMYNERENKFGVGIWYDF